MRILSIFAIIAATAAPALAAYDVQDRAEKAESLASGLANNVTQTNSSSFGTTVSVSQSNEMFAPGNR